MFISLKQFSFRLILIDIECDARKRKENPRHRILCSLLDQCGQCRLKNARHSFLFLSLHYILRTEPNPTCSNSENETKRNNEQFRKLNNWKCDSNKTWNASQLQRQLSVSFLLFQEIETHMWRVFFDEFSKKKRANILITKCLPLVTDLGWMKAATSSFGRCCCLLLRWMTQTRTLFMDMLVWSIYLFVWLSQNKLEIRHKSITLKSDREKSNVKAKN